MEGEPLQEKNLDEVLNEIDWENLGAKGGQEKAAPPLPTEMQPVPPAKMEPSFPAKMQPPPPAKIEPVHPAKIEPVHPAETEPPSPAFVQLFHRGSDIEIVRKWLNVGYVAGGALAVAFCGWLVFYMYSQNHLGYLVLSGAGLLLCMYFVVGNLLNRTTIVVSRDRLVVRHRPIPWVGNKDIAVSDLKYVCTDEHMEQSRRGGTRKTYKVYAIVSDWRHKKLVDAPQTGEQAYFIEQQIEQYLGIKDS